MYQSYSGYHKIYTKHDSSDYAIYFSGQTYNTNATKIVIKDQV